MKIKKLLPLILVFLLGGCFDLDLDFNLSEFVSEVPFVPGVSLHPLYTEDELIFEEKLLGAWGDEVGSLNFEKAKNADIYNLTLGLDTLSGRFIAHLVKIDKMLFLDLSPQKPDKETVEIQQLFSIPAHTFLKIEQIEPILKMRMMNPDTITYMLKTDPNLLKHELIQEELVVLTASTQQLQQFMKKYANDESLFADPTELERLKPKDPNVIDPNTVDVNCADSNNAPSKN